MLLIKAFQPSMSNLLSMKVHLYQICCTYLFHRSVSMNSMNYEGWEREFRTREGSKVEFIGFHSHSSNIGFERSALTEESERRQQKQHALPSVKNMPSVFS